MGLPGLSDVISEVQASETLPSEEMDINPEVGLHTHPPHKCTHTRTHVHNILLVRCGGTRVSPQHLGGGGLRIRKSKPETATEDPILKISYVVLNIALDFILLETIFGVEIKKQIYFDGIQSFLCVLCSCPLRLCLRTSVVSSEYRVVPVVWCLLCRPAWQSELSTWRWKGRTNSTEYFYLHAYCDITHAD